MTLHSAHTTDGTTTVRDAILVPGSTTGVRLIDQAIHILYERGTSLLNDKVRSTKTMLKTGVIFCSPRNSDKGPRLLGARLGEGIPSEKNLKNTSIIKAFLTLRYEQDIGQYAWQYSS